MIKQLINLIINEFISLLTDLFWFVCIAAAGAFLSVNNIRHCEQVILVSLMLLFIEAAGAFF